MFGVETEYAVSAFAPDGAPLPREECVDRIAWRAAHTLPHVRGANGSDFYLQNGSRFYIDAGQHPEMSSPECLNPWDVVRYVKAGDVLMERLADGVPQDHKGTGRVLVFKGNVDYSGSGATWGSHESYLHGADPEIVGRNLIPHLVSRVIYTGAGGFNSLSPGLEFMLSPRAAHLTMAVSDRSTSNRGIVHTRNESLSAAGYRRQHLICGESLQSDLASWLRVGVTALVVALVEAGVRCGEAVALASPLEALRRFSADVECRSAERMSNGPPLTAVQIQRHYLHCATEHLGEPFMPPWAGEVCNRWAHLLNVLEHAPHTLARTLDWAIKLALYQERARRRGVDWNLLPAWTHVVATIDGVRRAKTRSPEKLTAALVLAPDGPVAETVQELRPYVRDHRLQWTDLDAFFQLRHDLFEIDTRFGQVGGQSLFGQLDASGVLDHAVPGIDAIEYAVEHPPAEGRAHVRGDAIRRLAHDHQKFSCQWSALVDSTTGAQLNLSDPFTEHEAWDTPAEPNQDPSPPATAPSTAPSTPGPEAEEDGWLWAGQSLRSILLRRPRP